MAAGDTTVGSTHIERPTRILRGVQGPAEDSGSGQSWDVRSMRTENYSDFHSLVQKPSFFFFAWAALNAASFAALACCCWAAAADEDEAARGRWGRRGRRVVGVDAGDVDAVAVGVDVLLAATAAGDIVVVDDVVSGVSAPAGVIVPDEAWTCSRGSAVPPT